METESRFLDENYIRVRLDELKEIRNREYSYTISRSNRENSKSIYVRFDRKYIYNGEEHFFGGSQVRISDHPIQSENNPSLVQFIVDEKTPLSKGRKAQFMNAFKEGLRRTKRRNFLRDLSKL